MLGFRRPVFAVSFLTFEIASFAVAQDVPPPPGGPPGGNRFNRRIQGPPPPAPTPPATSQPNRLQQMFNEANELAARVQRSGPWDQHAKEIEKAVESIVSLNNLTGEAEQFGKRLIIEVSKLPPWEFDKRLNVAGELIKERYGLNDEQMKKMRSQFVRNSFTFFVQNAEQILPVAREFIETWTERKPVTPEMVARWTIRLRPIFNKWYGDAVNEVNKFCGENLTPEQREKVNQDMGVLAKHVKLFDQTIAKWQQGGWEPDHWGLGKDPVHAELQAQLERRRTGGATAASGTPAVAAPAAALPPPPPPPSVAAPSRGPMRIGDNRFSSGRAAARATPQPPTSDDAWSAYVRQFITRYGLDESQKSTAYAILKDMQERAQAYRSSRSDQIAQAEKRVKEATSAEERNDAQTELRDVLKGMEDLFEELKTRLQTIPTADQIQRAGS